jgi:2-polyprenyl-3-methyl-5-hydroxy-6-metoxy-1,4-benzoquinol methylase
MLFKNGKNFKNLKITLYENEKKSSFFKILQKKDRSFTFDLDLDGQVHSGTGVRGDDAVWLPLGESGLKVFSDNDKYDSLDSCEDMLTLVHDKNPNIFPDLNWHETKKYRGNQFTIMNMENVSGTSKYKISANETFLPTRDRQFADKFLQTEQYNAEYCIKQFYKYKLNPEDEWYKSINMIDGKIVDFHRFKVFPQRYKFPSNGKTQQELQQAYNKMVKRYLNVLDPHGMPKWKGRIYQGFEFDNGYEMEGYSSDGSMYDSYKKLPFIPWNKVKGKKVLDIGSNQGFFSFQAAIHGASSVVGIELQKEDFLAANDLKNLMGFDNVEFLNTDAIRHLKETNETYGLIIANSVLHQIYRNLEGADDILDTISSKCEYFAFETPANHTTMRIGLSEIYSKLSTHFKIVRLLYVYDAYSSGYRANFVCYS